LATAQETAVLTLAEIRPTRKPGLIYYLFHQRERIFTLPQSAKPNERTLRLSNLLDTAFENKQPVKATFDTKRGVIQRAVEPTNAELEEFARMRIPLEKPEKIVPIEVNKIDPTTFNIEHYLRWPIFQLCTKVIPNYAKAKEIFDFCAGLSCNLPGPYAVTPCIPFQYVIDGCYARAHQMRRIITTRYGYCCEKVFSFGTNGDTLAVQANKWGGCCVTWWYHVAPLVRVRVRIKGSPKLGIPGLSLTLAMVIDPGMFDKPVLLSSWLAAQENQGCASNAHVTSYSIQPGSAYWPSYGGGFDTDPNYTLTEQTLIAYSGLTTC
jgi:hypothetical protein